MTAVNLTDDQLVEIMKAWKEHGTKRKAADAIGMNYSTFLSRVKAAEGKGITANIKLERTKAEEIKLLKRQLRVATREADSAEKIRTKIYEIAETSPAPPKWTVRINKGGGKQRDVAMMNWSDWHWGEVVKPEEIGGVNEYNSVIARQRVTRLVESSIDIIQNHMPCGKSEGIVICLGGDMINGIIHPELEQTNDDYVLSSLLDLQDAIVWGLEAMADVFGKIFVPCVVGNHGRTTLKPRMKGRVYTNYEWNLYSQLERYFRNDKRIHIFVPGETDAYFTVAGHRFLLTHGDSLGVRGGDGIIGALGPIMRGAIKTGRSEARIGRDFDTIVMGHWHQYISIPGIIVNNCLKGYDDFARLALRAPATAASQALWGIHPKWGITSRWEVYVQDPITPTANNIGWVGLQEKV